MCVCVIERIFQITITYARIHKLVNISFSQKHFFDEHIVKKLTITKGLCFYAYAIPTHIIQAKNIVGCL